MADAPPVAFVVGVATTVGGALYLADTVEDETIVISRVDPPTRTILAIGHWVDECFVCDPLPGLTDVDSQRICAAFEDGLRTLSDEPWC